MQYNASNCLLVNYYVDNGWDSLSSRQCLGHGKFVLEGAMLGFIIIREAT